MKTSLLNIGFGNAVVAERIIAVITPRPLPARGLRTKPGRIICLLMLHMDEKQDQLLLWIAII
jgi:hypothetical protein